MRVMVLQDNTFAWKAALVVVCFFTQCTNGTIKQCVDGSVVGMASPAFMTGGRDIRQTFGRGYVMTNRAYASTCCGLIKGWTFHKDNRALDSPVTFHLWRPDNHDDVDDDDDGGDDGGDDDFGNSAYRLVGKTDYYAESRNWYRHGVWGDFDGEDDDEYEYDDDDDDDDDDDNDGWTFGVVSVPLAKDQRISIREGDIIGWRSPHGDVISYTTRYFNLDNVVMNRMGEVEVGDTFVLPSPLRAHRTYGINAVLTRGSSPVFTNLPTSVDIPSDVIEGSFVFNVTGYDENPDDVVAFRVADEEDDVDDLPFSIHPASGTVTVEGPLRLSRYEIPLTVTDPCGLQATDRLLVNVVSSNTVPDVILPETLSVPVTDGGSLNYTYSIVSNADVSRDVRCHVEDVDPPFVSVFTVTDSTRLHVYLTADVTGVVRKTQEVTSTVGVTCADDTSSVTKHVTVRLFHRQLPRFLDSSSVKTINVSARVHNIGDVVHIFQAAPSARNESSLMFKADDCHCPFYLYPDGRIAVTRTLMSEPVTSYSSLIYVTDGELVSDPATVYFLITDVNLAPRFLRVPSSILVDENSSGAVMEVKATDDDGDPMVISITWFPAAAGIFLRYNQTDQTISIRPSVILDFELMMELGLTEMTSLITVSDGFKTSSVNVTLVINDVNEPPVCSQSIFYISVVDGDKGAPVSDGSFLTSSCWDPESRPLNYAIKETLPVDTVFVINSLNASLLYASAINVKTAMLISFTVHICDVGSLCTDVDIEAEIRHARKKPRILNLPRRLAVSEDMAPGKIFVLKTMVDETLPGVDETTRIYFRGVKGNHEIFEIKDSALCLKQSARFDFETTSSHNLQFLADDGYLTSDPVTLIIDIMDVNERPEFLQENVSVRTKEGEAGAVILSNLWSIVRDQDRNETLTFSLLTFTETFDIHPLKGTISLAVEYDLDRDVMPREVVLVVRVTDSGNLSATARVTLTFEKRNEAPRILNLPREVSVPEDAPMDSVIYRVVAEDPDGDDVILHMSVINPARGRKIFLLNETDGTVALKGTRTLNFEDNDSYVIRVIADDGVLVSPPMMLTLLVVDVNEAPYFTKDVFYVSTSEGPAGTLVGDGGILSATRDPDEDDVIFHLDLNPHSSTFSVDRESAELTFATDFALTRQSSPLVVNLTIRASDPDGLSATAPVVVTIYDENIRPRLLYLPVNITVPEDAADGSLLYTVYAEDEDDDYLLFRINTVSGGGWKLFRFNSTSGELHLASGSALSSRRTPYIQLHVSVTDRQLSSHPAILGLLIVPAALQPPVDRTESYTIRVSERELDLPIHLPEDVFTEEIPPSQSSTFGITGGNGRDYFQIDSKTGSMLFIGNYDERYGSVRSKSSFTLGITRMSTVGRRWTRNMTIEVIDENDFAPEVTSELLTWFVNKDRPIGAAIGRIEARDRDRGENGRLSYEIVSFGRVPKNTFRIDNEGNMYIEQDLNPITQDHTTVEVVISDHGQPPLSTPVAIFIVFT